MLYDDPAVLLLFSFTEVSVEDATRLTGFNCQILTRLQTLAMTVETANILADGLFCLCSSYKGISIKFRLFQIQLKTAYTLVWGNTGF